MTVLTDHLPLLAGAPNGINRLRQLIIDLAASGRLIAPTDKVWPLVPLSELVASFQNGVSSRGASEGIPVTVLRLADVKGGRISLDEPRQLLLDSLTIDKYHLSEGDILVIRVNGSTDLVGRFVVHESSGGALHCDHFIRLQVDRSRVVPRFLKLVSDGSSTRQAIQGLFVSTAGQKTVNQGHVGSLSFKLPSLAEQHRSVAKVDELMVLCDTLEIQQVDAESAHARLVQALLDSLTRASDAEDFAASWQRLSEHFHTVFTTETSIDALKQTLLQLAVMGKLVPQDPSDEPANELLQRVQAANQQSAAGGKARQQKPVLPMTDEEKPFDLPRSWIWSRLGTQVIESGAGWSPNCEPRSRTGNEWGVLKVSAVSWGVYRPDENKALPANLNARPEHQVSEGDFLVSRANTAELVARSVVVESSPSRLMLSDKIVRLKLTTLCNKRFVNLANSAGFARSYYSRVAGGTSSSMKNVARDQILNLPLPLPPLAEQHRIVARVDRLMALCDQLKSRLTQACQLNQKLASALVERAVG